MYSTIELEQRIHSLIRRGLDVKTIIKVLGSEMPTQEQKLLLEECAERACEDYPDYDLIQFFVESKIIIDKDGEDDRLHLFNLKDKEVRTIDRSRLNAIISSKLDWSPRRYTCKFTYNPYDAYKLKKINREWNYNVYVPPEWAKDYFYSSGKTPLPIQKEIPELYRRFINHLVGNNKDSYNYVLDWTANALQKRNFCYLVTIGNRGIGKGVFGDVLSDLFGEYNFSKTDKKLLTKDFNGQASNKRLIYLDEVTISNEDQENKLKNLVNTSLEIEKKGHDAKLTKNYSSIYFSSNSLDAIPIPSDNRRYSLISLTTTRLTKFMTNKEIDSLRNPENIAQFAYYLMSREVNEEKMMEVFESEQTEKARAAKLKRWQEYFIDVIIPKNTGKQIKINEVSEMIELECGSDSKPGRTALSKLQRFYSNLYDIKKVRIDGEQKWVVEFYKQEE